MLVGISQLVEFIYYHDAARCDLVSIFTVLSELLFTYIDSGHEKPFENQASDLR